MLIAGGVSFALLFAVLVLVERPGFGLGRFLFLSVVLVALATDAWLGALAGVFGTVLYIVAVFLNPQIPQSNILTLSTLVRFVSFVAVGALIGYFAKEHRVLVGRLRTLAERDDFTGLPRGRAFESEMSRRLASADPLAILIGAIGPLVEVEQGSDRADALRRVSRLLTTCLDPRDSIVRVGEDEFGVLTSLASGEEAAKLTSMLESVLDQEGLDVTFGWAVTPQDGANALSLCQAADERRYARMLIRAARPQYA